MDFLSSQHIVFDSVRWADFVDSWVFENYSSKDTLKIVVIRNHSFEFLESFIHNFLAFSGITAKFYYSDYDDSLSFNLTLDGFDIAILWIDSMKYFNVSLENLLISRIRYLETVFDGKIITFVNKQDFELVLDNIYSIENILEEKIQYDNGLLSLTGTSIKNTSFIPIARAIGLKYIPWLVGIRIKAIVVDLDNTLYSGILAEDGYQSVIINQDYQALHEDLIKKKKEGFFLCLSSKNEISDVEKLFSKRKDLLLSVSDFDLINCSWQPKSQTIIEFSKTLNIGLESILFIDDNPGEIIEALSEIPELKIILADEDPKKTLKYLNYYPGIIRPIILKEDNIRANDLKSNLERSNLISSLTREEYLCRLGMELSLELDNISNINRCHELLNKTNQFITGYTRFSINQVKKYASNKNYFLINVALRDTLSDSGIISVFVGQIKPELIIIEDLVISCRALGRGIESYIIYSGLNLLQSTFNKRLLKINFIYGQKNKPASDFFETSKTNLNINSIENCPTLELDDKIKIKQRNFNEKF